MCIGGFGIGGLIVGVRLSRGWWITRSIEIIWRITDKTIRYNHILAS